MELLYLVQWIGVPKAHTHHMNQRGEAYTQLVFTCGLSTREANFEWWNTTQRALVDEPTPPDH